uniref:Uncharacterized protein n=1 Tax=Steinernema glaseri TaxID=37863 RepID=A0A1I7YNX5_9BILA
MGSQSESCFAYLRHSLWHSQLKRFINHAKTQQQSSGAVARGKQRGLSGSRSLGRLLEEAMGYNVAMYMVDTTGLCRFQRDHQQKAAQEQVFSVL